MFTGEEENPFAENDQLIDLSLTTLKNFLWKLDNGLSYHDFSIFIEEHTLLVVTKVQSAICKVSLPMVLNHTRNALIDVFKKMIEYIESREVGIPNFTTDLKIELTKATTNFITNETDEVARRLKRLLDVIFALN